MESVNRFFAEALLAAPLSPASYLHMARLQLRVLRLAAIDVRVIQDASHPLRRLIGELIALCHRLDAASLSATVIADELNLIRKSLTYADHFGEDDFKLTLTRLRAAEVLALLRLESSVMPDVSASRVVPIRKAEISGVDSETFDIFGSL
jgi:hypothetical protein